MFNVMCWVKTGLCMDVVNVTDFQPVIALQFCQFVCCLWHQILSLSVDADSLNDITNVNA